MASRDLTEQVKIGLALGAIVITIVGAALRSLQRKAARDIHAQTYLSRTPIIKLGPFALNIYQSFLAAVLVATLFATVNYNRYNTDLVMKGYDEYDLLHYYVNAKYFDELGYFRLLPALIIATDEAGPFCQGKAPIYLAQDTTDYHKKPISHALKRTEDIKSHFSDTRWRQFVHDATYLQRHSGRLPCFLWRQLLQDHGFNGTPAWVLVARPLSHIVPVEHIKYATIIDLLLICAMLGMITWAFGTQTTLFAWMFITISYSFRWPTITWVLLRYDWLAFMVMGICLIKKKKHTAAGAFFGYATLMRYFPGLWLFGIAAKGIHCLLTSRNIPLKQWWKRIPKPYYLMAAGFFATIAVIGTTSVAVDGITPHKESFQNLFAHIEPHNLSSMRQGLAIALTYRGETDMKLISAEKKQMVASLEKPLRWVSLGLLGLLGLFLSRANNWEAVGLGLIPYFFLTTSSYYYYSMRLTAVVIHAADLSKRRNVVGLLILFAIELFCNASEHINNGNRYFLISIMGIMLSMYSIVMMAFLGRDWWIHRHNRQCDES